MKNHETIKEIVTEIKDKTGVKQKYLAQRCGYSEKKFSQIVNGHKTITDIDIEKLCRGLGKTPNDLIKIKADTA